MIPVSNAYKAAVNADQRHIKAKVEVYFAGDNNPPVTFTDAQIVSMHLLEESRAESDSPFGLVSSNELTIAFDNSNRDFTPTNTDSPYYEKLRPRLKVKAYLQLEIAPSIFEELPLGVFSTGDWSAPSASLEATVTGYDLLYDLGAKDVPMLPVCQNTTIGEMFVSLFTALGLGAMDFSVDPNLKQNIPIGWLPNTTVLEALQILSVAGNCNVAVDRYGKIQVRSNLEAGQPVAAFTDQNQIFDIENQPKYLDTYSAVKVNYKTPYLKLPTELFRAEGIPIPTGSSTLQYQFLDGPVANLKHIKLTGANVTVTGVEYGAWGIRIGVLNTGQEENVNLVVTGQTVGLAVSSCSVQDAATAAEFGVRELKINNDFIQSKAVAEPYAISLLKYISDPLASFSLSCRGNPAVCAGDVVTIDDQSNKIGTAYVIPTRINLDYDGALTCSIEARKKVV